MDSGHLDLGQGTGWLQRVDAGAEEGFVDVDVAQTGNPALIEEDVLDRRSPAAKGRGQHRDREVGT